MSTDEFSDALAQARFMNLGNSLLRAARLYRDISMAALRQQPGFERMRESHASVMPHLDVGGTRQNVLAAQEIERLTTALTVARAHVREAASAVALAQQNLQKTSVRAPYAGSVAERLADEGTTALVQPQTIVVVLEETVALEARASIAESQMGLVRVGDVALLRIQGLPEPLRTSVSGVADSIDPATRTYLVKMPVPNPEHRIKAGVFAHVEIEPRAKERLLAPREAIRIEDGRSRLLVIDGDRVDTRIVDIGVLGENEVEILAGADGSERVIVGDEARTVVAGMRVRVIEAEPAPGS